MATGVMTSSENLELALSVGASDLPFYWDFGDQQTRNGATVSHTYEAIDGYLVKLFVQSEDGACKDTLAYNLKLTLITGVSEIKTKENTFKLYPNPTTGLITVECSEKNLTVELLDNNGRILLSEKSKILDISRLAKGMYYIRGINGFNEIIGVEKVFKE